tara:strand:+ start:132 stop:989 length:858 start_codon:yes stop_codon:yes gene_type:complete
MFKLIIQKIKKYSDEHQKYYIWLILQKNQFRTITSPWRKLPEFIIIGCARSGTVALNKYLNQHNDIEMASRKEVHFFNKDIHYEQGLNWYKSFFPIKIFNKKIISGEATPDYIYNPKVPKRIKKILPNVKLIVVLRDPIDRAYSHYHYMKRTGRENLTFEDAIKGEEDRIGNERKLEKFDGDNYRRYSYLDRGLYLKQIQNWRKIFSKNQILIIKNEDLEENLESTLNDVFIFLNVKKQLIPNKKKFNVGQYPPIKEETKIKLISHFKEHNKKLEEFLDRKLNWN